MSNISKGWLLACVSETGTCHVFAEYQQKTTIGNGAWIMGYILPSVKYFKTEGSFAKFHIGVHSE
jgi:hypothetical protein